ncbi:MAG: hypothetical protein ACN4GZ_05470, partial [Acidimicrobiales bacterium]
VVLHPPPWAARSPINALPLGRAAAAPRFHDDVAHTYAKLAESDPDRFVVLSADDGFRQVELAIWAVIEPRILADST